MSPNTRALTALMGILTTIMVGWLLHVGAAILQPLVIALLLASMLSPIVRWLARYRIPPAVTVILMVVLLFLGLARLGILLGNNVRDFAGQPVATAPDEGAGLALPEGADGESSQIRRRALTKEQEELIRDFGGWDDVVRNVATKLNDSSMPGPLREYIINSLVQIEIQGLAGELIGGGFGFTKGLLLVLLYMLFIFAEQAVFRRKILSIAGDRRGEAARVLDTIGRGIQRYLGVKTIISITTGSLCYAALVFLKVPYALLFGLLTFLLNYIPTFGSIIAGSFPTITAIAIEGSFYKAVMVVIVYLAVNVSLGSFLEPKILGRELNLSPLVIIISVVVWAGLWGVVGTFLAVPLTAAMQIILASNDTTRPIAVMLSSGPPREDRRRRRRASGAGGAEAA